MYTACIQQPGHQACFFHPSPTKSCDPRDNALINQNETNILNSEFECKVSWQPGEQSVFLVYVEAG